MYRRSILFLAIFAISNSVYAQTNTQNWECALDLHQGDSGTLSLQRVGDKVDGMISISRNANDFTSDVEGFWVDNEINIKRLLDAGSNEPMTGIVVTMGTKEVKMGGRYSAEYQGVWSADCDLVSASTAVAGGQGASNESPAPSTSSRVSPSKPTNKDRIKFSALASHPDGVKSVSFFVGDKKIHTCESAQCEFSYGPLSKGKYTWRVEAVSESGLKSSERSSSLIVRADGAKGNCAISGVATGTAAGLSAVYSINLYGPDNQNQLKGSTGFENNTYQFTSLTEGDYVLRVDTKADKGVLASPSSATVKCKARGSVTQDFDFR